jgi:Domain of unknown function (DUF4148)
MNLLAKANWIVLLIGAASAGAYAQSSMPKTRDEVRQELADALRDGTIPQGELGLTPRELYPNKYPKAPAVAGRTRAEVLAELEAARRSGDLLADGESSLKLNELHPSLYPPRPVVVGKTRAQVVAELAQAQRSGDMLAAGDLGLTLKELHPGQYPRPAAPVYAGAPAGQATQ